MFEMRKVTIMSRDHSFIFTFNVDDLKATDERISILVEKDNNDYELTHKSVHGQWSSEDGPSLTHMIVLLDGNEQPSDPLDARVVYASLDDFQETDKAIRMQWQIETQG